ncbi:uncharacterized protein FA14DRAFT_178445 [Meira miltonrushii]|uniref:RanBD1 domain-containing protein n=1 Tax=Meira miltonrushii TaxID=1280837 RepID=A0A316VCN5_9BASI|nr:uncharacterized protein FA14DRAFT_178445 [Meira miltonrushii]PWN35064.1 hypothetical protein FA14DRAFT_178445 [Meira miltonrushii]
MVREVVRKRRQNDGAGSKKAATASATDDAIQSEGVGTSNDANNGQHEEDKIQSSTGKAPSARQTRKLQSRASLQAPYANLLTTTPGKNNSTFNSPRTPLRTPRSATTKRQDLWGIASPTSPNSPSMRALNAIVSFISPYASARRSAAFGDPEEDQDRSEVWKGKQKQNSMALVEEDDDENDEEDIASSLYPPLPSDPNSSLQAITKDNMENDTTIIEQTIDQIEEDDEDESEEEEDEEGADEHEQVPAHSQIEDDEQSQPSEADVVIIEEDVEIIPPSEIDGPQAKTTSRTFSLSSNSRPEPTFGAPSAIGLAVSEGQSIQNLGESTSASNALPLPAARSPFQTNGFIAPRESTPSKMGFGAIATEPVNSAFKPVRQPEHQQPSVVPPSSAFTFGVNQEASTSRLPQYPRVTRPAKTISPLAKNYELLARFFAEKAEKEARAEASASISSMDEDGNEQSGALTEIELAGCMRLIEQSYAQGQGEEVERLRHEALRRAQAPQIQGDDSMDNHMDEDEVHFAKSHIGNSRKQFISRSPSLPLGAAAGEAPVPGLYGYRSRPSSSFLAPTYRDPQDVRVNQSLTNIFGNSATVPPKRKHRPLYLGPGVGATATSAILKRTQQMQARKSALTTQRASLREQLRPLPMRALGRSEVAEEAEDSEGPRKRRKLPDEPLQSKQTTAPVSNGKFVNQKTPEQATVQPTNKTTPPSLTATADAMLSILSSGPSIPSRSPAGTSTIRASTGGASEAESSSNPELVNPYETRSRLRTRSAAPTSTNSSSTAAAKEKERLKEEREKRLKAQKEREARKESTLDFIKRTAPTPPVRRGRQIRLEEEDDDDEEEDEEEAERESEKAAAAEAEEKERAKAAEENKKRKNEELKRRMDKLNKDAKSRDTTSDGAEPKSSTQPTSSSIPISKSFSFNSGFAPKKPSPLSQAASNHVPDSPSASSESSERSIARTIASPQKGTAGPPTSSTIVIEDDEEEAEAEAPKPKAPLFNFGSANSSAASKTVSAPTPTLSFSAKAPEPTAASTSQPATSAPFSFGKTVNAEAPTAPTSTTSASVEPTTDRDQAANAPVSSLPKFDFTLDVVLPESSDKKDEAARKSVTSESVESLPKFDFGGSSIAETSASTETAKTFSFSAPKPAATGSGASTPTFAFKPTPSVAAAAPAIGKDASETSGEPGSGATSGDDSAGASDKTKSALLAGTGEGEEDENSLHEVRCKIWNLSDGKWNDLGIGALKIKKHKTTSKKRVLVRNEGNGKVTVNFNIMSTFKPTQDKNVVTFLGFDQTGKPTNYRCKIKTEGDAKDLKEALENSAKEAA